MQAPRWLGEFREDLEAFEGPRVCALATADARVRMVVLRDVGEDGSLAFTSDERSRKNATIRSTAEGEACFWASAIRTQWRLAGSLSVETEGERWRRVWDGMSPTAKALFVWPASGEPVADAAAFPKTYDGEPNGNYGLIVLRPVQVDRLDLRPHPHRRTVWHGGTGVDVNP